MMRAVILVLAAVGVIVLVTLGAQIFQAGTDQIPDEYRNTTAANATADQLEMLSLVPAYLPYGLLALGLFVAVIIGVKVLS